MTRVPRMQALPWHTRGSTVTRSCQFIVLSFLRIAECTTIGRTLDTLLGQAASLEKTGR